MHLVYPEYQEIMISYRRTQKKYLSLVERKEELLAMAGPSAIRYDKEKVQTSVRDTISITLAKLTDISAELDAVKEVLRDKEYLLKQKRQELRASRFVEDQIFCMYFVDGIGVRRIAMRVGYSRSQVFRILKKMRLNATPPVVE